MPDSSSMPPARLDPHRPGEPGEVSASGGSAGATRRNDLATEFLDDDLAAGGTPSGPDTARDTGPHTGPDTAPDTVPAAGEVPIRHATLDDDSGPGLLARLGGAAVAVAIGLAGAVLILTWLLGRSVSALNPFDEQTVDRSGRAVLLQLNDLKTYQAASGYYEIVIDQETDVENLPAFLAGERVIFVAAGSVDASVDFAGLGSGNVTVNADRTEASIALPAPVLGAARLDLERSYVADHRRGLRERLADAVDTQGGGTNTEQLYRIAQARLAEAGARTDELKARARTNTRAMLTSLLTSLGFREVTVTFADEK